MLKLLLLSCLCLSTHLALAEEASTPLYNPTMANNTQADHQPVVKIKEEKKKTEVKQTEVKSAEVKEAKKSESKPVEAKKVEHNKANVKPIEPKTVDKTKISQNIVSKENYERYQALEKNNIETIAKNQELQMQNDNLAVQVQVLESERTAQLLIYGAIILMTGAIFGFMIGYFFARRQRPYL